MTLHQLRSMPVSPPRAEPYNKPDRDAKEFKPVRFPQPSTSTTTVDISEFFELRSSYTVAASAADRPNKSRFPRGPPAAGSGPASDKARTLCQLGVGKWASSENPRESSSHGRTCRPAVDFTKFNFHIAGSNTAGD